MTDVKYVNDQRFGVGVIIGRFQTPNLHQGHHNLIHYVKEHCDNVLVLIGVSPTAGTKKNPLDYPTRRTMFLEQENSNFIVAPLLDMSNDIAWTINVDSIIRTIFPFQSVSLFGGRDSCLSIYKDSGGTFTTNHFSASYKEHQLCNATEMRTSVAKQFINSVDFRKGVIYSVYNNYPRVFPCVDMAVLKKDSEIPEVLMGLRPEKVKEKLYSFPGGFVDPTDNCYEDAAIRELEEEMRISVSKDHLIYVTSTSIDDWRYSGTVEKINTILYKAKIFSGRVTPTQEMIDPEWIPLTRESLSCISKVHKDLFIDLLRSENL